MSKTNKVLRVVSQREGFRRAGFTFGRTAVDVPVEELTAKQRAAIEGDPSLVSMEIDKPEAEEKDAPADGVATKPGKK